jgi:hypothetical protein
MTDIPEDCLEAAKKALEAWRALGIVDGTLDSAVARAILAERERCAQVCRDQAKSFLSTEYAANQPLGSFCERFACECCEEAILSPTPSDH